MVHGGLGIDSTPLHDWNLFDFRLKAWVPLVVKQAFNSKPFSPCRYMHTLTPTKSGFYLFGGLDEDDTPSNNLHFI